MPSLGGDDTGVRTIAFRLFIHVALATVASTIVGTLLLNLVALSSLDPHFLLRTLLLDVPYSPAFWGTALLIGYLVNRQMHDHYAFWVGPIGALMLVLMIGLSYPGYEHSNYELRESTYSFARYIYGELFSLDSKFSSEGGLGKLMFTMPVLNCIAYSFGAWLAVRRSSKNIGLLGR